MPRRPLLAAASATCVLCSAPALADVPTRADVSPAEAYRHGSLSLLSDVGLAIPVAAIGSFSGFDTQFGGSVSGLVGMTANIRGVIHGVVIGGEIGTTFAAPMLPSTTLRSGLSAGWTTVLLPPLAVSVVMHTVLLVPTAANASVDVQVTGELSLECFLGKHGFIEPVLAVGDLQDTRANVGLFVVGVSYRLGVVF